MKSAIRNLQSMIVQRRKHAVSPFWPVTALLLVSIIFCSQVRAETRPDGSPTGQKSPERNVPVSKELLKKAVRNAKSVAPDSALERAGIRPAETKISPNPSQLKLLPDNSLPDSPRLDAPKRISLTDSKESVSKPEGSNQDKGSDGQAGNSENAVNGPNGSIWEPTGITVSRVFLATDDTKGEVRKIPMNVPVLYESRLLALDKEKQRAIARLLDKLVSYRTRLATLRKEGADLLAEWNQIISSCTPQNLLLSDSPTLIEKETRDATSHGENIPGFEAGKGVSVEVKSKIPNQ